jgi:ribonucleotide monophosphatase NagD (HAD superfamily)
MGAVPWDRVVAVGDSVEHDIRGAHGAGLRSVLIAGGVHIKELGAPFGVLPTPAQWQEFSRTKTAKPDYLIANFVW